MKTKGPKVKKSERVHRGVSEVRYVIDLGMVNGKRVREFRSTLEAANVRASEIRADMEQMGAQSALMTAEVKRDAINAWTLLNGSCSLTTAVEFYIQQKAKVECPTVATVIQRLMESKAKKSLRPRSMAGLRWHLSKLESEFGPRLIRDIGVDELQSYFGKVSNGSKSVEMGHIRYASIVFGYAVKKDYLSVNPCTKVDRPEMDSEVPEFMPVLDVAKVFSVVASSSYADGMIPRMALGFFAGIRVEELDKVDWRDVNIPEGFITIRPEVAKCGIPRHVTISPNLEAWLMKFCKSEGPVGLQHQRFAIRRREIVKTHGLKWPQNAMRHTFATNHIAMWGDAGKTAFELGHTTGPGLLYKSYRGLTTKKDAEAYWEIKPSC